MSAAAEGKAIPPVPVWMKKLLHLVLNSLKQAGVGQSALVTLHRHAWVDGPRFLVPLQKPDSIHTHTHALSIDDHL